MVRSTSLNTSRRSLYGDGKKGPGLGLEASHVICDCPMASRVVVIWDPSPIMDRLTDTIENIALVGGVKEANIVEIFRSCVCFSSDRANSHFAKARTRMKTVLIFPVIQFEHDIEMIMKQSNDINFALILTHNE